MGIDPDPDLVRALAARARERCDSGGSDAPASTRSWPTPARSTSVAASRSRSRRCRWCSCWAAPRGGRRCSPRVRAHLEPGALFAAALADPFEGFDPETALPPLPDVREEDGWVLSSLPVAVRADGRRRRDRPPPPGGLAGGRLTEEVVTIRLDSVDAPTLEAEGRAAGFTPLEPRRVPETADYVGSTVVILEC